MFLRDFFSIICCFYVQANGLLRIKVPKTVNNPKNHFNSPHCSLFHREQFYIRAGHMRQLMQQFDTVSSLEIVASHVTAKQYRNSILTSRGKHFYIIFASYRSLHTLSHCRIVNKMWQAQLCSIYI